MSEIKLASGAVASIVPADFDSAISLHNVLLREAAKSGLDIEALKGTKLQDLEIKGILPAIMGLAGSETAQAAIWKCLIRCTIDGEKITKGTFENVEMRKEYYAIVWECLKENLSPFFGGAISASSGIAKMMKTLETQKSE